MSFARTQNLCVDQFIENTDNCLENFNYNLPCPSFSPLSHSVPPSLCKFMASTSCHLYAIHLSKSYALGHLHTLGRNIFGRFS